LDEKAVAFSETLVTNGCFAFLSIRVEMGGMSRIVLIHGFATGIRYSVFRPAYGEDAGFSGFRSDIASGDTKVFRWDIKENASFFQSLNPFYTWHIYRREKRIASDADTYRRLHDFLTREQPDTIACHSMGCYLLVEYLNRERLPESVHRIIFNQADIPAGGTTFSSVVGERLRTGALRIINTFCFWDPTLWCSVLIGGSFKAGLVGLRYPLVNNRLFPLYRPWNLHMSAMRDGRFRDLAYSGL
jgi:hypothetical protein